MLDIFLYHCGVKEKFVISHLLFWYKTDRRISTVLVSSRNTKVTNPSDDGPILKFSTPSSVASPKEFPPFLARLLYKFLMNTPAGKSPNQVQYDLIKTLYKAYKQEDATFVYCGWKKGSKKIIACIDDFPDDFDEFRKFYAEGLRTRTKGTNWFKMRAGWSKAVTGLTSDRDSKMNWWFEENKCGAFLTSVQDSDNVVILGDMLYSGGFIDCERLQQILISEYARRYPTEPALLAGCCTKQCKQIKVEDKKANSWIMAANQPICIEVDRSQASKLKLLLYQLFNKQPDARKRPGNYNILFLPAEDQMQTGSAGTRERQRALRKHKLVVQSLTVVKAPTEENIHKLDKPIQVNGTSCQPRGLCAS